MHEHLVAALAERLRARGWRLATAESCTGGLLAAACTSVAGSSDWFERGIVSYSNAAKVELLGVEAALIERHGAVSEEVARAMAAGLLQRAPAQLVAAITGIYALLDYSLRMAPGRGFSGPEEGARYQVTFYRTFVGVLNTELQNFRLFFGTALAVVDELKETGAFVDPLPYRFLPQMKMDLYDRENFSSLVTLLLNVSSAEQRKSQRVLAHLDLERGLRGLNQHGRDSVKAFLTA